MPITIQATKNAALIAQLNASVQQWHHEHYPEEFKPFDRVSVEAAFEQILQGDDVFCFVALDKGAVVGYWVPISFH